MELKSKDELKREILETWMGKAWVYPVSGPDERPYLRLTPGGRLKMRRRIGELEAATGLKGTQALEQDRDETLPAEREKLELAMMVQAYDSERRLIASQGIPLAPAAVQVEDQEA